MTHHSDTEISELIGRLEFREGLLADFGAALTKHGETASDAVLGSDLSETAPVLGEAATALQSLLADKARMEKALDTAAERVMKALWPLLGGNHTEADLWHDIGVAVGTALSTITPKEAE